MDVKLDDLCEDVEDLGQACDGTVPAPVQHMDNSLEV